MQEAYRLNGPVVIGGVGGSGTRVVAQILSALGFYMGSDLNRAKDNLWFTLLFKRPKWYQKAGKKEIFTGFGLLSKVMLRKGQPSLSELKFVLCATVAMGITGHNHLGSGRGLWPLKRTWRMFRTNQKEHPKYTGWGWKEPNSYVYIDYMAAYFDNLQYIHMIRNGLDMAFSRNQQQLLNWGWLYGVEMPKTRSDVPRASLKYWVKANQRVFDIGQQLGDKKFLVVHFEKLCLSPISEVERITAFLNITPDVEDSNAAISIPKVVESIGRHKAHDLSQFDTQDLEALQRFGVLETKNRS